MFERRVPTLSGGRLRLSAEVVENSEEECDTDLERQNVEELYDYVRHVHQSESQQAAWGVQHKALIPVLRLYQSQAVNWMLRREKHRSCAPKGTELLQIPSSLLLLFPPALKRRPPLCLQIHRCISSGGSCSLCVERSCFTILLRAGKTTNKTLTGYRLKTDKPEKSSAPNLVRKVHEEAGEELCRKTGTFELL